MVDYQEEEKIWHDGFRAGYNRAMKDRGMEADFYDRGAMASKPKRMYDEWGNKTTPKKRKQKPSAWNKFVKANSKKKKFIYQSGANKGKLNLKKMGVAWRKTAQGKKKR